MISRAEALIELAGESFELFQSEKQLLQAVVVGKEANYSAPVESDNDPTSADEWGIDRTIRAALLVWLCTEVSASQYFTRQGLVITGAKVKGLLDLSFDNLDFPLTFSKCAFEENVCLERAKIRFLAFSGSCFYNASLEARGIQVESDVFLNSGFHVKGQVLLYGATIGGYLDCSGSTFDGLGGDALMAQFAEIKGPVFLRDNFHSTGTVSFLGTTVGGSFDCDSGEFINPEGYALDCENTEIKGSVFLRDNFYAHGSISLVSTTIGGNLDCSNSTFHNPDGNALTAENAKVEGSVYLNNGFDAEGVVYLRGIDIGSDLNCAEGSFANPDDDALSFEDAKIGGSVFLRDGFYAEGRVPLHGAK